MVAHNTLAASDYGLIDEVTLEPRPNYWSAVLWRKMMGTTVLDAGRSPVPSLHLYAHCLRDHPGGVALLAINADPASSHNLEASVPSEHWDNIIVLSTTQAGHGQRQSQAYCPSPPPFCA